MVNISIEDVPFNFVMYGGITLGLVLLISLAFRSSSESNSQNSGVGNGQYLDVYGNPEN